MNYAVKATVQRKYEELSNSCANHTMVYIHLPQIYVVTTSFSVVFLSAAGLIRAVHKLHTFLFASICLWLKADEGIERNAHERELLCR